jgi:hypothetical protein
MRESEPPILQYQVYLFSWVLAFLTEILPWQHIALSGISTRMLRQLCLRGAPKQSTARLTAAVWASVKEYSTESGATLASIDPSKLSITRTTTPKELLPPKDLVFGQSFTGMCVAICLALTANTR